MVSRDLARVLKERYPAEQATENYLDQLRTVVSNLVVGIPAWDALRA
jgi:hypothetical protein